MNSSPFFIKSFDTSILCFELLKTVWYDIDLFLGNIDIKKVKA